MDVWASPYTRQLTNCRGVTFPVLAFDRSRPSAPALIHHRIMAAQIKSDATSIVVVGNWNPAILQPNWIAQNVLGASPADVQVEMEFSTMPGAPPRYRMRDLRFVPNYDKLIVYPDSEDAVRLNSCADAIQRILELLPHTPVRAAGINFEYFDDEPSGELLSRFTDQDTIAESVNPGEFEITRTALQRALTFRDFVLNFTRELVAGPRVLYKFNFHHQIINTNTARAALTGQSLLEKLQLTSRFVNVFNAI